MSLEALVTALLGTNNRRITDQRIMNSRIRNQIGLEFIQIDIKRTIEAQGTCNAANNLRDQSVEVIERWTRDIQITAADIIHSFIVNQECAIAVLDRTVGGQDGIVGLDDGGANSGSGVDGEFELGFLAVVCGEALKQEGAEA